MAYFKFLILFLIPLLGFSQINGHPGGGGPDQSKNDNGLKCSITLNQFDEHKNSFYRQWYPNEKDVTISKVEALLKEILFEELSHIIAGTLSNSECENQSMFHMKHSSEKKKALANLVEMKKIFDANQGKSLCVEISKIKPMIFGELEQVIMLYEKE